ncbi:MAG: aminoglycoside 3'-phosphotransferase [Oscillospiraceae bacterium]|nr:aminoglycoside 3'-phosphotransferase [Oscillospiraceae bacterium]
MKRTPIIPDLSLFPEYYHALLEGRPVFDSSCSQDARVYFLDTEGGLFLKTGKKGALETEARMNTFFHSKGLGPEVLSYRSEEADWLLTRKIHGEDCTHPMYISDPKRLCDTLAHQLRTLHETDFSGCPVTDKNQTYRKTSQTGYLSGTYEPELFETWWDFASPEDTMLVIQENAQGLQGQVLLHGDYCLPNILLDNWKFSGFIDLGNGGIGDRHIDLLWALWTVYFNLHTHHYRDRFIDAYGRQLVDNDLLRTVAAMEVFR